MAKTSTLFEAANNFTTTTNGMGAYKSTFNACLDLFFIGPSLRTSPEDIGSYVVKAYEENPLVTLKLLFYFRDIRGNGVGQGERAIFRAGIKKLIELDSEIVLPNLKYIPTYGRWDDLLYICNNNSPKNIINEVGNIVRGQLKEDIENIKENKSVSLLAKWLPSCNTSSDTTRRKAAWVRKVIFNNMPEKVYRKTLSTLRSAIGILETYMSQKNYTFDYSKLPGKALLNHTAAFLRHDSKRFLEYKKALESSDSSAKINASTLSPADIIHKIAWNDNVDDFFNLAWKALPNYFDEKVAKKNWLAVADVSGSMYETPLENSVAMALYIAERNTGIFKDQVITFTEKPRFFTIDPELSLKEKFDILTENAGFNTDLDAVFEILLSTAQKYNISQEEMPEAIIIITDCQFDTSYCGTVSMSDGVFDMIKKRYSAAGYIAPKLVFWNAAKQNYNNVPITQNEQGVILVSGTRPGMFETILGNKSPFDFMMDVINNERYNIICVS